MFKLDLDKSGINFNESCIDIETFLKSHCFGDFPKPILVFRDFKLLFYWDNLASAVVIYENVHFFNTIVKIKT